jgi:hypothetical protein
MHFNDCVSSEEFSKRRLDDAAILRLNWSEVVHQMAFNVMSSQRAKDIQLEQNNTRHSQIFAARKVNVGYKTLWNLTIWKSAFMKSSSRKRQKLDS